MAPIRLDRDGWRLYSQERVGLSRETCRLQAKYMSKDRPVPNFSALIAQHPNVHVVACGAVLQAEMARIDFVRQKFTRPESPRIARRTWNQAPRSGLIDASHARGLLDYAVSRRLESALARGQLDADHYLSGDRGRQET